MLKLITKVASATFLFALMLASEATAERRLPPCPKQKSVSWDNCHGNLTLSDGEKYVGEFKDGAPNGQGTATASDGNKYVGEWKDGKPNGQGTQTWPNGEKYVGEFRDGEPNGQGTLTLPDGRKYVGEFKDGEPNGQGTQTWPDGVEYVGEFKDREPNGQGTYTWPNGEKFVGELKANKRNGYGTLYSSNGTVKQFGVWKDDMLVGSSAENSSNKAITSALGLPEKTDGYLPLILLAIAAVFLMKHRTEPSIRVQQDEQKREKEEAEAAARERQRQQEEQYRRHDSSSGKMSADQALEILGLKSGAPVQEIRAAYNRLMKRVHPDVGGSSVFAKQLNRARDVLIE